MDSFFAFAGLLWWGLSFVVLCATCVLGLLQPAVQKRRATCTARPPVSAILPVKSLDQGFERAQTSIFVQDYPDYEIFISAAETESAALAAMHQFSGHYPGRTCQFIQSIGIGAVSPKLDTLATPILKARHDFILTKDSNITLAPDSLAAFMQNFAEGVGLVVAVPVAVRPKNLAGRIEAWLINGHARLLLTASTLGAGFGVGKVMLFRRSDLAKAGGLKVLSNSLAEDTALSRNLAKIGLQTTFSHKTVSQETGARSFREIYDRQLRWCVIRRAHEPLSFPLEPLASPLPAALAGALAAPIAGLPVEAGFAATLLIWFAAESGFAVLKGWEVSVWSPLAFLGREILSLAAWLRAWTTYDVVWASRRFDARKGPASKFFTPDQ
jgi:ceramide glucosyltransferase